MHDCVNFSIAFVQSGNITDEILEKEKIKSLKMYFLKSCVILHYNHQGVILNLPTKLPNCLTNIVCTSSFYYLCKKHVCVK